MTSPQYTPQSPPRDRSSTGPEKGNDELDYIPQDPEEDPKQD